jgi:hypothetical protein
MKAIPIIIPRVFTTAVTATFMPIAPLFQAPLDGVFIRVNTGTQRDGRLDQWLDRLLLDVF